MQMASPAPGVRLDVRGLSGTTGGITWFDLSPVESEMWETHHETDQNRPSSASRWP
jgi:hypothetical protein